jgi:thiamine-phosphate diphosphorylase
MLSSVSPFCLHVVTDGTKNPEDLVHTVVRSAASGADVIQLRRKSDSARELYELASRIRKAVSGFGTALVINDRIDVAMAVQADGIHVAGHSLPLEEAAAIFPRGMIGCSVHSVEEAVAAEQKGATYITFGHIYPTGSKPGIPPRGVDQLAEVVGAVSVPVIAIGGITADNVGEVLKTGCAGVAVISAVMSSPDPAGATKRFKERMAAAPGKPRVPFP